MKRGFTLVELIVVIIIVGILAAVGISQYSAIVEKSRLAEAKTLTGTMRQLAYEYYLKNGSLSGISSNDLDVGCGSCNTKSWFYAGSYFVCSSTKIALFASRCTSNSKPPNGSYYSFFLLIDFATGKSGWYCQNGVCGSNGIYGIPYGNCDSF